MAIFYRATENKPNIIKDYGIMRLEKLLRLRDIAMSEHNLTKLYQANRLVNNQTRLLNNRYHHQNQFNQN